MRTKKKADRKSGTVKKVAKRPNVIGRVLFEVLELRRELAELRAEIAAIPRPQVLQPIHVYPSVPQPTQPWRGGDTGTIPPGQAPWTTTINCGAKP